MSLEMGSIDLDLFELLHPASHASVSARAATSSVVSSHGAHIAGVPGSRIARVMG